MLATVPLPGCWVRTRTPSSACSRSRAGRCASAAVEPAPGCRHYLRWPHARMSAGQQTLHVSGVVRFTAGAPSPRAARWRITNYLKVMRTVVAEKPLLKPMEKALATLERHADAVVRRGISGLTNARLEGMNGLF